MISCISNPFSFLILRNSSYCSYGILMFIRCSFIHAKILLYLK